MESSNKFYSNLRLGQGHPRNHSEIILRVCTLYITMGHLSVRSACTLKWTVTIELECQSPSWIYYTHQWSHCKLTAWSSQRHWIGAPDLFVKHLHVIILIVQCLNFFMFLIPLSLAKSKGFISVGLIVFGAFVAGARDLSFDSYGYAVVFISNITTAIYLATIARIGKSSGLNSFGLMWCNGLICGPILLFWTFIRGDLEMTANFPHLYSPGFLAVLILSCILAFFLNYSIFLNTTLNSALTQTMCGNLKDFFTVGLGWLLFGGLPFDLLNVIGQCLGFIGSGFYAYCKLKGK